MRCGLMSTRWSDGNAPQTNFAVTHALPRIAVMDPASGHAVEALMSATAKADPDAKARVKDFLEKRPPKKVMFDAETTSVDARPAVPPVLHLPRSIT
jgi:hypothetical protein